MAERSAPVVRTAFQSQKNEVNNAHIGGLSLRIRGGVSSTAAGAVQSFAVQSAVWSMALNTIPTASVTINVGVATEDLLRDGDGETQLGQMIDFLRSLTIGTDEAEILISPVGDFDDIGTQWPKDGKTAFKGFVAGQPSFSTVSGQIVATIPLRHTLSKLTYSSALSSVFHQGFPWNFAAPLGGFPDFGAKQGACNISEHIGHSDTAESVSDDVWGAIKKLLVSVCLVPIVRQICLPDEEQPTNTDGLAGLAVIEGPAPVGQEKYAKDYADGAPTALAGEADVNPQILTSIADFIVKSQTELFGAHDLWSLIIGVYLPQLGLVLAPTAEGAVVMPDSSSLSPQTVWASITADEQFSPNISMAEGRLIRGVVVLADALAEYNVQAGGSVDEEPPIKCAGGGYIVPGLPGSILPVPAPLWLSRVQAANGFSLSTTGLKNGLPVNNAIKPGEIPPAPDQPGDGDLQDEVRELFDAYAKSVFVTERLRGRRGSLTGKLRFDIGPGSIVRIERENDIFSGQDASTSDLYGYVYQVTVAVSAQPPSATTTFGLSNLRTHQEVLEDDSWFPNHPLYGSVLTPGVPLIADFP